MTNMHQINNKSEQTDRCRLCGLFCVFLPDDPMRWFTAWFSNLQSPLPASCISCWFEPSPRSLDCSFRTAFTLTASSQKTIVFLDRSFLGLERDSSNSFLRALLQPSLVLSWNHAANPCILLFKGQKETTQKRYLACKRLATKKCSLFQTLP